MPRPPVSEDLRNEAARTDDHRLAERLRLYADRVEWMERSARRKEKR